MTLSEPGRTQQDQWHNRIINQDATAFAELCEVILPHLINFLQKRFPAVETHLQEMVTIDCLLSYQSRPEQYDPHRLSLFAFLRMATRNDLLNALDKKMRRERRLTDIDDPVIQANLSEGQRLTNDFELEEWLAEHTSLTSQEVFQALDEELDDTDRDLILLMLDGVRDSRQYATVMGISHLDTSQQRSEVKRAKDRLTKKLRRFGSRLDND